ncbi:MAG: hypothetical protein EU549_05365 [Promethearchaeota archaeon]|nr:MAG: hypothetical protein EU549_05365 [Candidatus Lokiarchaeota archaeon]
MLDYNNILSFSINYIFNKKTEEIKLRERIENLNFKDFGGFEIEFIPKEINLIFGKIPAFIIEYKDYSISFNFENLLISFGKEVPPFLEMGILSNLYFGMDPDMTLDKLKEKELKLDDIKDLNKFLQMFMIGVIFSGENLDNYIKGISLRSSIITDIQEMFSDNFREKFKSNFNLDDSYKDFNMKKIGIIFNKNNINYDYSFIYIPENKLLQIKSVVQYSLLNKPLDIDDILKTLLKQTNLILENTK